MQDMTALEIIRLIMPEMKDVDDATIEKFIELYRPLVSEKKFRHQYEHGVALLVGHKLKLLGYGENPINSEINASAVTGIASVSEGNTSISFDASANAIAATDPASAEYAKTIYGLQFLALRRQMVLTICIDGVM